MEIIKKIKMHWSTCIASDFLAQTQQNICRILKIKWKAHNESNLYIGYKIITKIQLCSADAYSTLTFYFILFYFFWGNFDDAYQNDHYICSWPKCSFQSPYNCHKFSLHAKEFGTLNRKKKKLPLPHYWIPAQSLKMSFQIF